MPARFTKSMADNLNQKSQLEVKEAEDGEILKSGCVYIAPGGFHMTIVNIAPASGGGHMVELNQEPPVRGLRPYANYMYQSLSTSSFDEITCVVLSGMGNDGTEGIFSLKQKKPIHVICQDAESSVVYGMPKSVVQAELADEVLPFTEIAQSILRNVGVR